MGTGSALHQAIPAEIAMLPVPMTNPARYFTAALWGAIAVNREWIRQEAAAGRPVPPLYKSGIYWKAEQNEAFLPIPGVLARGWGDCDDVTAWRVAELRESGVDPKARPYVRKSKSGIPGRYHALVLRGNGKFEDPSEVLGMGKKPVARRIDWTIDVGSNDRPAQCVISCGTRQTAMTANDWPTAAGLAAREMLQLQRLGLVPATPQARAQTAALAVMANPAAQEVVKRVLRSGALDKLPAGLIRDMSPDAKRKVYSAVTDTVDKTVAAIPPPYGPIAMGAKTAIGAALNIMRAFPTLRRKLPSFMR